MSGKSTEEVTSLADDNIAVFMFENVDDDDERNICSELITYSPCDLIISTPTYMSKEHKNKGNDRGGMAITSKPTTRF